jgi:two-component system, OmpR family, KDP operon response regulator KdpE
VEDDVPIRRFVRTTLESRGFAVSDALTGSAGLALAHDLKPDLVILDLGLPDMDGVEVARRLREWSTVPILVLSARNQESAKVEALDAGADDYLGKPFGVDELLARIRAALRRADASRHRDHGQFSRGEIKVDLVRHQVWRAGREVRLTPIEYRLFATLIRNSGRVMTYRQLLKDVWGGAHSEDNHYVRIYMAQLRHKLEKDPAQPRYLLTEAGVGYRLAEAETD